MLEHVGSNNMKGFLAGGDLIRMKVDCTIDTELTFKDSLHTFDPIRSVLFIQPQSDNEKPDVQCGKRCGLLRSSVQISAYTVRSST